MKTNRISRRKKLLLAGGIILLILAILAGVFFWYVSDYYRAEDVALAVTTQSSGISQQDNLTILSPTYPTDTANLLPRRQGGGGGLPAAAGSDPAARCHLHPGAYALPYGDF